MITVPIPPVESGAYFGFDRKTSPKKTTVTLRKEDVFAVRNGDERLAFVVFLTHKVNPILQRWLDEIVMPIYWSSNAEE